ncbi:MAG: hypothetical protein ABL998_00860 [Planctomycetota bacterium]
MVLDPRTVDRAGAEVRMWSTRAAGSAVAEFNFEAHLRRSFKRLRALMLQVAFEGGAKLNRRERRALRRSLPRAERSKVQ